MFSQQTVLVLFFYIWMFFDNLELIKGETGLKLTEVL